MTSLKISQALQEISASTNKPQLYESIISEAHINSPPNQLPNDYIAILDAIFADSLGIVATRALISKFVAALKSIPSNGSKIIIGQHALDILQSQASSFEELNTVIREVLATAYEAEGEWLSAAKVLSGIPLDSSQRKVTNEEKVRFWIRITRNCLEADDTTLAEQYLNKAKNIMYTVDDRDLNLHFRLSQARIQDGRRNFLDAAYGYHDISLMGVIAEEERLHTLRMAIKCTILAPAGPIRSRVLGRLYKDDRASNVEEYGILEKMLLNRLLSLDEVADFAKTLAPHQLAKMADGYTVLEVAVVEHNLRSASRLYNNIRFNALASLLGLDEDKAEETTARMIEQGRLAGRIDQIERVIWFEGDEATGQKTSGQVDSVVGQEMKQWDANIQELADEVENVISELQLHCPQFVAANMKLAI